MSITAEADDTTASSLPKGWVLARLGEVTQPSKAKVEPTEIEPTTPYLSLEHIEAETGRVIGTGKASDVRSTKSVFNPGDVLYGKLRPYLNKVVRPDFSGVCSTDIIVFPQKDEIDADFLAFFLRQRHVVEYAHHNSQGVQLPRISFDVLSRLEFPLLPLAEQKRVVAMVAAVLTRVNAARERLAKTPTILKRFRQSLLAAACSGRLTADWRQDHQSDSESPPSSWEKASVAQVCKAIVDCPHSTPKWTDSGEICLRTTNFKPGLLDLSEVRYVSGETYASRIARLEPQQHDILYSREGGILGIACLFPAGLRACLGQRMMLMRPGATIRPHFLMHVLNSPQITDSVRELTGGTASPHLNVGDVKAFEVPLPPLEEQDQILNCLEQMLSLAKQVESRVVAATTRADTLMQATLAKAFRGGLVPTDAELAEQEGREYETAESLLDRIRKEGEADAEVAEPRLRRRMVPTPSSNGKYVETLFEDATLGAGSGVNSIARGLGVLRSRWAPVVVTAPPFEDALLAAFKKVCDRQSPDRVVADPELQYGFVEQCRKLGLQNAEFDLCFSLLNLRKSNELKGLDSARKPVMGQWKYAGACEIAARVIYWRHGLTVDRIICHPTFAEEFEQIARNITPGYSSFEYRWAALGLRKHGKKAALGVVERLRWSDPVSFSNLGGLPAAEGVYALHDQSDCLFVYGTMSIRESITAQSSLGGQDFFGDGLWRPDPKRLVWKYAKASGGATGRQGIVNTLISEWEPVLNVPRVA